MTPRKWITFFFAMWQGSENASRSLELAATKTWCLKSCTSCQYQWQVVNYRLPRWQSASDPCHRILWRRTDCTCPCYCCRLDIVKALLNWFNSHITVSLMKCDWRTGDCAFHQNPVEFLFSSCWGWTPGDHSHASCGRAIRRWGER